MRNAVSLLLAVFVAVSCTGNKTGPLDGDTVAGTDAEGAVSADTDMSGGMDTVMNEADAAVADDDLLSAEADILVETDGLFDDEETAGTDGDDLLPDGEGTIPGGDGDAVLPAKGVLDGAFLWVDANNGSFDQERWTAELSWMREIGMTIVIVAASVIEDQALYPTAVGGLSEIGAQPLEKILAAADAAGMEVHLGLVLTNDWWAGQNEPFLDGLTTLSNDVATELLTRYGAHNSLKGLYIPQEIDNMSWQIPTERTMLAAHFLKPVSDHIKSLAPAMTVSEAPFFNRDYMQPVPFGAWWQELFLEVPNLDLLVPQDGISAEHATLAEAADYFDGMKDACDATGRRFWADLEIYALGEPYVAPLDRIIDQIETEHPFSEKIVVWEFDNYISPAGSPAAFELFHNYKRYLVDGAPLGKVSSGAGYSFSKEPDAAHPDDSGLLTDGETAFSWENYAGWLGTQVFSITLDLGDEKGDIGLMSLYAMRSDGSGVGMPQTVDVAVSSDGTVFSDAGTMEILSEDNERTNVFRRELDPVSARYVRFTVTPSTAWTMIAEIGVYAE